MPLRRRLVCGSMPTTPRLCELTLRMLNSADWPSRLGQDQSGVQGRAVGHRFVGRHRGVGLLAAELLQHLADHRHAGRTADQQHASMSVHFRPAACSACRVKRVRSSRSCVASSNCSRVISTRSDLPSYSQVMGVLARAESVRLASSHSRQQLPAAAGSCAEVERVLALESSAARFDQPLVPVLAAQLHVAVGGQGQELAAVDLHHGHVERAAAQVVDQHLLRLFGAALAVRNPAESRRRWRRPSAR